MGVEQATCASPSSGSTRWLAVASASAFLITVWVYHACLDHGFLHWDDRANFVDNEAYRGLSPQHLWWMFNTFHMGPYQPLSWVSLGLDYLIWGMDPWGYHLTNLLIHAVNASLAVWVTALLFAAACRRARRVDAEGVADAPTSPADWVLAGGGLAAALLWGLHPQRVESVAWVTERRDVMCGLFYLLCVWCHLRCHEPDRTARSQGRWRWATELCCLAAVLSKGTAVSLPVVLLVLDVYPLGRLRGPVAEWWRGPQRRVILEKVSLVFYSLLAIGAGFWGQWRGGGLQSLEHVGLLDRLALAGHAIVFYLTKTVAPVGLSPMYARPVSLDLVSWRFLGSGLAVVALTVLLILARRRWPAGTSAWVCYVLLVLPVSGLVTIGHELVADRYSYLPTLAVFVTAGGALMWGGHRARSTGARVGLGAATAAGVVGLASGARGLIPIWHDDVALWERAVAVDPNTPRAQANLGGVLYLTGHHAEALEPLSKAVELDPTEYKPRYSLAMTLRALGRHEQALDALAEVIRLKPDHTRAREARGGTLMALGRLEEAVAELERAIELAPSAASLKIRLAEALVKRNDYERAVAVHKELLAAGCRLPDAYAGLAEVHLLRGHPDEADAVLAAAPPGIAASQAVRYALARTRSRQSRVTEALMILRETLRTWPGLRAKARLDPLLAEIREDKRFDLLLAELEAEKALRNRPPVRLMPRQGSQ